MSWQRAIGLRVFLQLLIGIADATGRARNNFVCCVTSILMWACGEKEVDYLHIPPHTASACLFGFRRRDKG
jgi:hypothetical protein